MNFACTQENLLQGLSMVSHVTGKNVNLPVLGNVLLKTQGGSLRLSATNLELAVSCIVRGKVETDGEYTVPAKLLLDYISLLPSGKVEVELKEEGLEIRSNERETIMKGMPASEFPLLPKLAKDDGYRLPAAELKKALNQVIFAVSTSEARPELTGVACFFAGDQVTLAATDSYRLAERKVQLLKPCEKEGRAIVPSRSLVEVARIISSYKDDIGSLEEVVWSFTENQLVVTYGNVEIVTRLIEGSFPAYQDFIPTVFKTQGILPKGELQKAVRMASLFSRQGLFDVHIAFNPVDGTCAVASHDQGTGKTRAAVKGAVSGEENNVMLNFRYLNDGLAAFQSDQVRIGMNDANTSILLLPEPQAGESYRYLVMPIRQ